ncbi:hypothetical protein [Marinitoga litoralis]|uniref:hypothetical protein n=1 Tax=Marinitoga litoralis TaxID=570855 RepID=UPI00196112F7|nr:hypothetical protein [Marinitoga litoralis]MBM7558358.1 hypothetical protein [Marinitoga litoralis]
MRTTDYFTLYALEYLMKDVLKELGCDTKNFKRELVEDDFVYEFEFNKELYRAEIGINYEGFPVISILYGKDFAKYGFIEYRTLANPLVAVTKGSPEDLEKIIVKIYEKINNDLDNLFYFKYDIDDENYKIIKK